MERGYMIRKLIVFPLNVLIFILALIGVLIVRAKERSIWMDRKIKKFKKSRNRKRKRK
jgi:hypothetical protein